MPKTKSKRQIGLLLSKSTPLTKREKAKLKRELHSGSVRVTNNKRRKRS